MNPKLLTFLFFCINIITAHSQQYVEGENGPSLPKHRGYGELIKTKNGYTWFTAVNRQVNFALNPLNEKLEIEGEPSVYSYELGPFGYIVDNVELAGDVYTLVAYYDKENEKEVLKAHKWDDSGLEMDRDGDELIVIEGERLSSGINGNYITSPISQFDGRKYKLVQNKEKTNLAIIYETVEQQLAKDAFYATVRFYGKDLEELYTKELLIPVERTGKYAFLAYCMFEDELFAYDVDEEEYSIYRISRNDIKEYTQDFSLLERSVSRFSQMDNGNFFIGMVGGYEPSEKSFNYHKYQQLRIFIFDIEQNRFEEKLTYDFTEEDWSMFLGNRATKILELKKNKNEIPGLYNPSVKKVYPRADGGYFVVLEQNYYYYSEAQGAANRSDLHSIVFSLSPKGEIISKAFIPMISEFPDLALRNTFFYDDMVHIVYYDNIDNREKTGAYTPELILPKDVLVKSIDLVVVSIDREGAVNKKVLKTFTASDKLAPYLSDINELLPGVLVGDVRLRKQMRYPGNTTQTRPFFIKL